MHYLNKTDQTIMNSPLVCIISLISLLLFLSLPSPALSGDRCHPNDKKVLLQIKQALNNPYHLASWDPKTDCCHWYVLECDRTTNRVIALTVFASNLSGQIPAAVGDLTFLETLMFHKLPNLNGTIPQAITKLTHLKSLILSWTNLSGPVPPFLSQLKNLNFLELSFNKLTGTIPDSLSELHNLEAIHLDRNKLTGKIPDSFGKFTGKIPHLYLSHNQLTGTVPKSLGDLHFSRIDFSRNKLVGDISFLFGSSKTIEFVDISRNMFGFDLTKVVFPASLTWLDMNHNMITGGLPAGLASQNLQFLNVSYNRLCGGIPKGGKLQSFDITSYFQNRCLCGAPLPVCK